jgi:hypothetical protein
MGFMAWVKDAICGWIRGSLKYHYAQKTAVGRAVTLCGHTIERRRLILNDQPPAGSQVCTKCERLLCPPELQGNPGRCITCPKEFTSFYNRCHGVEA